MKMYLKTYLKTLECMIDQKSKHINKIQAYDVISFDVFDTLIKRNVVKSQDVYKLVQMVYETKSHKSIDDFIDIRYNAEKELWKSTDKGEFTLENIYRHLENYYGVEVVKELYNIEKHVEQTITQKNYAMFELWNSAKYSKKTIILTSDMYLSTNTIRTILTDCNIIGYDELYVSGEMRGSKANGKLYNFIRNKFVGQSIIHVGDNFRDDYIEAYRRGIRSIHIKEYNRTYLEKKYIKNIADNIAFSLSNNNRLKYKNYWESIGYHVLGPLLVSFSKWLSSAVKKKKISKVVFLARDGYVLKKSFDLLNNDTNLSSEYFYVSRKSALIPNFCTSSNIGEIISKIKFRKVETYSSILKRLGVSNEDGNDFEIKRNDLLSGKYDNFLQKYWNQIIKNSIHQRECMLDYCKNIFENENIAIVDLGWNGTIQESIQELLLTSGMNNHIFGFYFGLNKSKPYMDAFASVNERFDANIVPFTRGIFETIFTADHPTVERYERDSKGVIIPQFCKDSIDKKTTDSINLIHKGALEYVEEFRNLCKELDGLDYISISQQFATSGILNLVCRPRNIDAKMFGSLSFNDTTNRKLVEDELKKGFLRSFVDCDWKIGFLKYHLKLNMPYKEMFIWLNRLRRK